MNIGHATIPVETSVGHCCLQWWALLFNMATSLLKISDVFFSLADNGTLYTARTDGLHDIYISRKNIITRDINLFTNGRTHFKECNHWTTGPWSQPALGPTPRVGGSIFGFRMFPCNISLNFPQASDVVLTKKRDAILVRPMSWVAS